MEKIRIKTEKEYECIIGENIISNCFEFLPKDCQKAIIIWDEKIGVKPISKLGSALETYGIETTALSVEGGEKIKSIQMYEKLLGYIIDANLDRNDVIYAVGGGSVSDACGFIASTYKRGIKIVNVPSTLLAACDAAIGGKTALNIGGEKNIIGTFYQPDLVIIDPLLFDTLSEEQFREGCAEIIKYGMICDYELIELITKKQITKERTNYAYISSILFRVIGIKGKIVEEDEYDSGKRNILNFGHTIGHAIEAESGFDIPHGYAVAMGMYIITEMAERKGIAEKNTLKILENVLLSHQIDIKCPFDISTLVYHIKKDKKVKGNTIKIIIPKEPGRCFSESINLNELEKLFNE